jgi:phosphonate metabolism protein PhnM
MYYIIHGKVITENQILDGFDLVLDQDRIVEIKPHDEIPKNVKVIDACGGFVCPGFIDIHSDYIEHMAAPRPTCMMDFNLSIHETEKELASHGITTIFHSLSLYKNWDFSHKPIRDPENVQRFVELITATHSRNHLIRHRFHARLEIDRIEELSRLKQYIQENKVHLISFMDHTPGQGQYQDLSVYRKTIQSYNAHLSDADIEKMIIKHQTKEHLSKEQLKEIAQEASLYNIAIASHDDDSIEKLEINQQIGVQISEFPTRLSIAKEAKKKGFFTLAGAPNILLGGSHSGNLSATEAILNDCIDILCSDYYPPALLHALFKMHKTFGTNLVDMIKMVTINPARAVKMDQDLGSIAEGKKADLLIIETIEDDFPVITSVFVDGCLVQKMNYRE